MTFEPLPAVEYTEIRYDKMQFVAALGAATLAQHQVRRIAEHPASADELVGSVTAKAS